MYRLLFLLLLAGCSTIELKADATYTGSTSVHQLDVAEFYLSLPPPPITITTPDAIFTPPPSADYSTLLALLHSAPGGSAITLQHLIDVTPYAVALVPVFSTLNTNGLTWSQLLAVPQVASLYSYAQQLLQPLGLWSQASLSWILQNWRAFVDPLILLYNQLTASGTTFQPPNIVSTVNPIAVLAQLSSLQKQKNWLELAEVGPSLIHSLVRHLDFEKPLIVIYGSKARGYAPALWTAQGTTNYTLSQEEGFRSHGLSEVFYQGADDISLNYYPVVVSNKDVRTLDVVSSERSVLLKRMAGGNTDLLDRAESRNTSLFSAALRYGGFRTRVVAGRTSYSELGGATVSWDVNLEYLSNHIAVGAVIEEGTFIGYAEEELTLRTPHLVTQGDERADLWGEVTLALSGTFPLQGDARVIPEVHTSITLLGATLHTYAGGTFVVAPEGKAALANPATTLRLVPVRYHVATELRVAVSEHWRVHADVVLEVSKLYEKAKAQVGVGYRWVTLTAMAELRNERKRFGAGIDIGPVHVQGLWPDLFQAGVSLEF